MIDKQEQLEQLLAHRATISNKSNPSEYARISGKIYHLRHPGYVRTYEWRRKNVERIKAYRNAGISYLPAKPRPYSSFTPEQKEAARLAQRRHELKNPQRKLRHNLERKLLWVYGKLAKGGPVGFKSDKSEQLLGCSLKDFYQHIQVQLDRLGWVWSDWRIRWTMDHARPVSKFVLPDEAHQCWHYSNLRPMKKELNHRGRDKALTGLKRRNAIRALSAI